MKKILFILFVITTIVCGQARYTLPDSIVAHRAELNAHADSIDGLRTSINNQDDSLAIHLDTLQAIRVDINNNVDSITVIRTDINNNVDSLTAIRTDVNAITVSTTGYLLSTGDTLEGDFAILDDTELRFGTSYPYMRMFYDDGQEQGVIIGYTKSLNLYTSSANSLFLGTNNTDRWELTSSGYFVPKITNTYDIGTSSILLRNLYTTGLTTTTIALSGTATVTGTIDATGGKVLIGEKPSVPVANQLTASTDQGESGLWWGTGLRMPDVDGVEDLIDLNYTYNLPEAISTGEDTLDFTNDRNFIKSVMTVAADNNLNLYFANSGYGSITIWVVGGWNPSGTINWSTDAPDDALTWNIMWVGGTEPPLDTSTSSQLFIINFTRGTSTIIVGQWNYAE